MMQMVRRHRRSLLLTLMLTVFVSVFSQSDDSARFSKYPYIFILDENQEPSITDEQFYKVALKVIFPVDVYLKPHAMMVRGASSPEGPYRWNQTLSRERSAHAFDYINRHLKFPEEHSTYNDQPEDYGQLLYLMKEANDPSYKIVKSLVDKYHKAGMLAQLKQHLKRIDGGRLWNRLYKIYYPKLRVARVVLFFKKKAQAQASSSPVSSGNSGMQNKPDSIAIEILPEQETIPKLIIEPYGDIGKPVLYGADLIQEPDSKEVPFVPLRLYRRHILGIRTNLLYDFFYLPGHYWAPSPNVQLEYYPLTGHFTANLGFTGPYWHHWSRQQFWQIRDYVLEGRYYFVGQGQFIGPYVSGYVHTNIYGIGLSKTKGWEGEGLGAGAIIGYTMNISRNKRWRLEFSLGVGYYRTKYDPYVYGNPKSTIEDGLYYYDYLGKKENFKERNHVFSWLGPTNIGVHLTYDLLFRRIQKKGVSFNRSELYQRKKGGADE